MADVPNATPVAGTLVVHGAYLAACGCIGAASGGWAPKVMHSAYAGLASCAALCVCAALTVSGTRARYMVVSCLPRLCLIAVGNSHRLPIATLLGRAPGAATSAPLPHCLLRAVLPLLWSAGETRSLSAGAFRVPYAQHP